MRLGDYAAAAQGPLARLVLLRGIAAALGLGVALTDTDRSTAEAVAAEKDLAIEVTAGETRMLTVTTPDGSDLSLINVDLSCTDPPAAGEASYTVFAADGTPLTAPLALCAEPTSDVLTGSGPFYVKVTGPSGGEPAELRIRFRTLAAG